MADLTTLAAVKAYGGITTPEMDVVLGDLITRASAAVENYLQAGVLEDSYTETRHGTGSAAMLMAQSPITGVQSLTIDGVSIPKASAFGQPGWWLADNMLLLVGYRFSRGKGNVVARYTAGYATTPPDIEHAVIETVMLSLNRRGHVDVSSKSLAGETITYITTELTPSAKQVLNSYRRVAPL